MTQRTKTLLRVVGMGIAIASSIVTIVYFFQPWRTCPYDDSPAACVMLPTDAAVMTTAMYGVMVGLVVFGIGTFAKGRDSAAR